MIKKSVYLLLIIVLINLSFVLAANETSVDKAYSCLENKLGNNCGNTENTEQAAFNLLAMAYDSGIQSDCKSLLKNKEKDNCWAETDSSSCNIKSTALAILALDNIGVNTGDYTDWLLKKRKTIDSLIWFLEIDSNNETECVIQNNNGAEKTFTIREDKKISGSSSCLIPAEQNYFLRIDNSCIDDNFTISCDKDFITTLIYKKSGKDVYYISSNTHSAQAYDSTNEKVESYCFAASSECDYEGSLWAALALAKAGKDISPYIPYISAMSEETANKKYLSSAFLYMLDNRADDYYSELVNQQKQGKYWDESGNNLYDSSLALLALQNLNLQETESSKQYLLSIQNSDSCWTSNTAFILFAAWPKQPIISAESGRSDCEEFNHYCVSSGECAVENSLDNFYCSALSDVCCDKPSEQQTCDEKQGIICEQNQRCTGSEVISADTNYCCLASCELSLIGNECENSGGYCKSSCSENQEEKTIYSSYCDFGEVCCEDKESKTGNWLLIILLIILIILVILAIIFRNQVKIWFFRIKSGFKFKKPSKPSSRPDMFSPEFIQRQPVQARHAPSSHRRLVRKVRMPESKKDSDFEETMKKLRDMSK